MAFDVHLGFEKNVSISELGCLLAAAVWCICLATSHLDIFRSWLSPIPRQGFWHGVHWKGGDQPVMKLSARNTVGIQADQLGCGGKATGVPR